MRRRLPKPTPAPALHRLGLATPPPFVGRTDDLAGLARALREEALLIVHGAVGSGKTRLAQRLAADPQMNLGFATAYIACRRDDSASSLKARAERALDAIPGSIEDVLSQQRCLLIIDDLHHLPDNDCRAFLNVVQPAGEGRVLVLTRDVLPIPRECRRYEVNLEGLDEASARELWSHHEDTYGPTPTNACDEALARTRGMPLALRREYARALFGADAWDVGTLEPNVRRCLEAIAVIRVPAGPAAVAALVAFQPEPTLIELVSRQLIDPLDDGRFGIHDVVRNDVLSHMTDEVRVALEVAAASLVSTIGRGLPNERRMAWDAGDDGALGVIHPVDRLREAVLHLLAAGKPDAAVAHLADRATSLTGRGSGGELLAIIDALDQSAELPESLMRLRAGILARQGQVSAALDRCENTVASLHPLEEANLRARAGEIPAARALLTELLDAEDVQLRAAAAAALADLELSCGEVARARSLAQAVFEQDRAELSENSRARLHLSLGNIEYYTGRVTAARAALARAAGAGRLDLGLASLIGARRATCLARDGRLTEASEALADASRTARDIEAETISDEIRRAAAMTAARRGDLLLGTKVLRQLVMACRRRGDELGAIQAEIDLASVLLRRGELKSAAELAEACARSTKRRGLLGLSARASLLAAAILVRELRLEEAEVALSELASAAHADAEVRARAEMLLAQLCARKAPQLPVQSDQLGDDIDVGNQRIELALAAGDASGALEAARAVAVRSERTDREADAASALAVVARVQLARGDRSAAMAAATRATRLALKCGLTRARAQAMLVLAALSRDEGNVPAASAYAQDAHQLAADAGLVIERLAAVEAIEAISGGAQSGLNATGTTARNAAAATMTSAALDASSQLLCDLGLTTVRPYRVVVANGQESFVADINPELLSVSDRGLVIDGVREAIIRQGEDIADLRRRSLLKRLLFLFAGSPGRVFSKEQIVETVWNVEYHPLRHDAALFTNIMRIRRLLGADGAELIRVSDEGYRFSPPSDFIFVEAVAEAA